MTRRAPRAVRRSAVRRTSRPSTTRPAWLPSSTRRPPRSRSTASHVESQMMRSGRGAVLTTVRSAGGIAFAHGRDHGYGWPLAATVTPRTMEQPGVAAVSKRTPRAAMASSSPGPSDAARESPTSTTCVGSPACAGARVVLEVTTGGPVPKNPGAAVAPVVPSTIATRPRVMPAGASGQRIRARHLTRIGRSRRKYDASANARVRPSRTASSAMPESPTRASVAYTMIGQCQRYTP